MPSRDLRTAKILNNLLNGQKNLTFKVILFTKLKIDKIFLIFFMKNIRPVSSAAQFERVKFWILNICCCFLQAGAVEKIKTNIQYLTRPNWWAIANEDIRHQLLFQNIEMSFSEIIWVGLTMTWFSEKRLICNT